MILVSGLGRCGTSVVMQMLAATGLPTLGYWPGYEDGATIRCEPAWWRGLDPWVCVKHIDPHRWPDRWDRPAVVLWCFRDSLQQARSQIKLLGMVEPSLRGRLAEPQMVDAFETSIYRDTVLAFRSATRSAERPAMGVRFSSLLRNPRLMAVDIAEFLASNTPIRNLDVDAMASVVRDRTADCLDGLLEMQLIREGPPASIARVNIAGGVA